MRNGSLSLRSPKKEEQEVPDTSTAQDDVVSDDADIMEELGGMLSIGSDESFPDGDKAVFGQLSWDFMNWQGGFSIEDEEEEAEQKGAGAQTSMTYPQNPTHLGTVKTENCFGFWDAYDEKKASLNLSLNYQEVLDAWSGRGSLWADDYSLSLANNGYMGEVPVMEEERARREASVLRYKEKRQSRLFSKKIRYEVRKLNADKRPRLKGRFVKRGS